MVSRLQGLQRVRALFTRPAVQRLLEPPAHLIFVIYVALGLTLLDAHKTHTDMRTHPHSVPHAFSHGRPFVRGDNPHSRPLLFPSIQIFECSVMSPVNVELLKPSSQQSDPGNSALDPARTSSWQRNFLELSRRFPITTSTSASTLPTPSDTLSTMPPV